ncbi:MAG: hypothetical protein J7L21_02045 [Sulfurimonas sp.]|nr:hypothetical protein [Sulfurimonas sp.]
MKHRNLHRKAIALLITVFFIIVITLSVGIGLKHVNSGSKSLHSEQFILQSSMILDDILKLLKTSNELQNIESSQDLAIFLDESSFMPFQSGGISVVIQISSARSKINPNTFLSLPRLNAFKSFLVTKMINIEYGDMLVDVMGGIKEDNSYNTDIFTQNPYLFRDYVASYKHLDELCVIYDKKYRDNGFANIDMKELFYISKDKNSTLDLNCATSLSWELILACDEDRADMLSASAGAYESLDEFDLSDEEKLSLAKFQTSFFEPYLEVEVKISQKDMIANIRFEYDIRLKRGYNFVYEV